MSAAARLGSSPAEADGRRFARRLAAIVAAGVAVRVVHTLLIAPWPPGLFNDEAYYNALGRIVAAGRGFVRPGEFYDSGLSVPTAERPPLFPALLAGLTKLGLADGEYQRLAGALAGGAVVLLLGLLARRLAGPRAGLVAAGLAAAYPTLIAADGALMTEWLFGLLAAGALLAAYRLREAPSVRRAALLGGLLGLAALTRGEAVLLLAGLLLAVIRRPGGRRAAAVAVVAFAVVLAPWTVRNASVFGRLVPVATEGGETLRGANCPDTYSGSGLGGWSTSCVRFSGRGNEAAELDALGHDGVRYALDHAGRLPVVAAARLARTWGPPGWPFDVPVEGRRAWVTSLGFAAYLVLLGLGALGLRALRRRRVAVWILLVPFVSATVSSLASYGTLRFRHGAELALVVLAAVGIDYLLARRARRVAPAPAAPVGARAAPAASRV